MRSWRGARSEKLETAAQGFFRQEGMTESSQSSFEIRRERPSTREVLFAVFVLAFLIAPFLEQAGILGGGLLACPFHTVTEVPCPTCGTTRSFRALAAFDPVAALEVSLFGTFFFFLLLGYVLTALAGLLGLPRPGLTARASKWFWVVIVVLTIGLWAVRLVM